MTKKIYVVLTLCLLFIGLPISATAQKATVIKGIVRDSITHEPISYASVFFVGSDKGLMTDDDGKFAVSVRDNFLNVRFSTLGYREKTVFVKKGAENDLVIDLVPSDYVLKEVVVKPKKEKYSKKNNPAVEFVRRMIESRDNYSPNEKDFWQRERYEKTTFALNNFDEEKQKKFQPRRFNHLKKEKRKKSKLCFVKEIAIPFNPQTGKEDDTFNPGSKWRPPFSVESVIKLAKSYAAVSDDAKQALMQHAGVTEWDASNPDVVTKEDYEIFSCYLTARIFSIPAVHVTIPSMCNNSFGRDYTVNVKSDPITGQYIGEVPRILQAHKFFIEMAYEELADYNDRLNKKEIKHDEKQQQEYRQAIFNKVPISDLKPINFIQAFEIPLDQKFNLDDSKCLATSDKTWVDKQTVLVRINRMISDVLDKFIDGDYSAIDKYPEYFVVDMSCPADAETPTELGKRTAYEKEMVSLNEMEGYDNFKAATIDYLDNFENLEETVFRSSYVSKYDSSVESKLLEACGSLIDINNPFLTQKVIESNKDFLMLALGEKYDELKAEIDCGISDKAKGNLDAVAAQDVAKQFDIAGRLSDEIDSALDEIETAEVKVD